MNAPAAAAARPPLPPRDADPSADAESSRIAAVVDRCIEWFVRPDKPHGEPPRPGEPPRWNRFFCSDAPEGTGLTWEEILDPRTLARCRPETIRTLWEGGANVPSESDNRWLWDRLLVRLVQSRGLCPAWIRALLDHPSLFVEHARLLRWGACAGDDRCRRIRTLAKHRTRRLGGLPKDLREDVAANAPGRFAIHAAMARFRWSPGAVSSLIAAEAGSAFAASLVQEGSPLLRALPPDRLLPFLCILGSEQKPRDRSSETAAALVERLEALRPGTVRACERLLGGGLLLNWTLDTYRRNAYPGAAREAGRLVVDTLVGLGADPRAPDFCGVSWSMRNAALAWVFGGYDGGAPAGAPPPRDAPAPRGAPPPPPPCVFHPFDRAVLFDGRPAALAAELLAHRDDVNGYLRLSYFRLFADAPRVLREVGPAMARELLMRPLGRRLWFETSIYRALRQRGHNARIWGERFARDPADREFAALFAMLVGRAGRRSFPPPDDPVGRGRAFPSPRASAKTPQARLRAAIAWGDPYECAAEVEALEAQNPGLVAKDEVESPAGSGPLWCALLPRAAALFAADPPQEGFPLEPVDRGGMAHLLALLARLGAAPDLAAAGGCTPRGAAALLRIPEPFPYVVPF